MKSKYVTFDAKTKITTEVIKDENIGGGGDPWNNIPHFDIRDIEKLLKAKIIERLEALEASRVERS